MNNTNKLTKIFLSLAIITLINIGSFGLAKAADSKTLIDLANTTRLNEGLTALENNEKLTSAATAKANNMLADGYFAHISPTGKTPWEFIKAANYDYLSAGENLAIGYSDNQELHEAWLASATHRANIVNTNFSEIGIAVVEGKFKGVKTVVVVQMFGKPLPMQIVNNLVEPTQKHVVGGVTVSADDVVIMGETQNNQYSNTNTNTNTIVLIVVISGLLMIGAVGVYAYHGRKHHLAN